MFGCLSGMPLPLRWGELPLAPLAPRSYVSLGGCWTRIAAGHWVRLGLHTVTRPCNGKSRIYDMYIILY